MTKLTIAFFILVASLGVTGLLHAQEEELTCTNIYPASGPIFGTNVRPKIISSKPSDLLVVSYNVHWTQDMKGLVEDFKTEPQFAAADFILLQEVIGDPTTKHNNAEQLAKLMNMSYVFAPARIYPGKGDYGNAILSRWPIMSVRKIILPLSSTEKCNQRATVAIAANVAGTPVEVYSVHLGTMFPDSLGKEAWRAKQMSAVVDEIKSHNPNSLFVIAGDFNTMNPWGWRGVEELMQSSGFINIHNIEGATFKTTHTTLDHAFARNLPYENAGNIQTAVGSDHIPIWMKVRLPKMLRYRQIH